MRDDDDDFEFEDDAKPRRWVWFAAAGLVIAIGAVLIFSPHHQSRKMVTMAVTKITLPPAPPPPPPKPPKPEPQKKQDTSTPQKSIAATTPHTATPHAAAPPGSPLTAPAGAGSNAYGLGVGNGEGDGGLGGDGDAGGDGDDVYSSQIASAIQDSLSRDEKLRGATFSNERVRLWFKSDGSVTRAQLVNSTGDAATDREIEAACSQASLGRLPDSLKQPVLIGVSSSAS